MAQAADTALSSREKAVLAADAERRRAMLASDMPALERVLDANLVFTHASGRTDRDRDTNIERLRTGEMRYTKIEVSDVAVRCHGGAAWVTGKILFATEFKDGRKSGSHNAFLGVWVEEGGAWRMVAWQTTNLPKA